MGPVHESIFVRCLHSQLYECMNGLHECISERLHKWPAQRRHTVTCGYLNGHTYVPIRLDLDLYMNDCLNANGTNSNLS